MNTVHPVFYGSVIVFFIGMILVCTYTYMKRRENFGMMNKHYRIPYSECQRNCTIRYNSCLRGQTTIYGESGLNNVTRDRCLNVLNTCNSQCNSSEYTSL